MKKIILLIVLTISNLNAADDSGFINDGGIFSIGTEPQFSKAHLKSLINNVTIELNKVNASRADSKNCLPENKKNRPSTKCIETYSKIYSKPTVEVRVVLGYSDAGTRPEQYGPHDLIVKEQMVNLLTKDCNLKKPSEGFFLCGFTRSLDDADHFIKKVTAPDGTIKTVNLMVTNSSVSTDEKRNKGVLSERQLEQTERAKKTYLNGIKSADVVLYNGHSRGGGGPDFAPARRLENNHIDYPWYKENKPGINDVINALKERTDGGPKLLGFFSCDSDDHFSKSIADASPKTGFIGTRSPPSWDDSHKGVLTVLNAILGKICDKSLTPSLNQKMDVKNNFVIERFWD